MSARGSRRRASKADRLRRSALSWPAPPSTISNTVRGR
jgi:hypothetical protein